MKKRMISLMMMCLPLLAIGCTKTDIATSSEVNQSSENEQIANLPEQQSANRSYEEQQLSNEPKKDPPQPSTPREKEQFEVAKSNNVSGWNKLKGKVYLSKLVINSEGMSWSHLPNNSMTIFSLDFPDHWGFNGFSVFHDQQNRKVAEIVPVAKGDITIEDLYQNYRPSVVAGEKVLSKELFAVNGYQGLRIISKNQVPWYPHKYFISNGSYIFSINFYSSEINESNQKLFEKIIKTFKFGNVNSWK